MTATKKKKCNHCNREFTPSKDNPQQEYCSEKCWRDAHGLGQK